MFEKDVNALIDEMTSFYREYLPMDSAYSKLLNAYIQSFLTLWEEAKYLRKHIALETAPTLQVIKYAKVNIEEALYSKKEALQIQRLSTLEEKLNLLNRMEKYTSFIFSELGSRNPVVYDMTLKSKFKDEVNLELYTDYFIRDNRLYIMPDYIINNERQVDNLHAFDIRVDNLMIEKKWGMFFDVETGPLLPRHKYKDTISAFQRLMSGDLSIRQLKESIRLATEWQEFDVQDMHSPNLPPRLRKLYDDWMISPAEFIVTLPEELISEKMQLNILLSMLDESKEEQVNYLVLFTLLRYDYLEHYGDQQKTAIGMGTKEILTPAEEMSNLIRLKNLEPLFPLNAYDVGRRYEYKMKYDDGGASDTDSYSTMDGDEEVVVFDNAGIVMDSPWSEQVEYVAVKHVEFPEIPRNLSASRSLEGDLVFTFRSNVDNPTSYELLGSAEEYGNYGILQTVAADSTQTETTIIHDETNPVMRYYKVRAIAGTEKSLPTLSVDSSTI